MFKSRANTNLVKMLKGAIAGLIATIPMTVFMQIGWMLLPREEQYPLPPREITETVAERMGVEGRISEDQLTVATLASHFGYGALAGAWYARMERELDLPIPALKGMLARVAVWIASYMGWIPALGILKPASQHPLRRNVLMILVHLVWGAALGVAYSGLTGDN